MRRPLVVFVGRISGVIQCISGVIQCIFLLFQVVSVWPLIHKLMSSVPGQVGVELMYLLNIKWNYGWLHWNLIDE